MARLINRTTQRINNEICLQQFYSLIFIDFIDLLWQDWNSTNGTVVPSLKQVPCLMSICSHQLFFRPKFSMKKKKKSEPNPQIKGTERNIYNNTVGWV